MKRILMIKFCSSALVMLIINLGLMLISTHMLMVDSLVRINTIAVAASITLSMAGLSVGLGAVFIDLNQSNPSAIISGFGGTLNLVLSLFFITLAITPIGTMFHLYYSGNMSPEHLPEALTLFWIILIPATIAAAMIPVWVAGVNLETRDF